MTEAAGIALGREYKAMDWQLPAHGSGTCIRGVLDENYHILFFFVGFVFLHHLDLSVTRA